MNREYDSGDQERQHSPSDTHLIGRRPTGKRTECDADDKVRHTYEYQPSEPTCATRCIHMCGPTSEFAEAPRLPSKLRKRLSALGSNDRLCENSKLSKIESSKSFEVIEKRFTGQMWAKIFLANFSTRVFTRPDD